MKKCVVCLAGLLLPYANFCQYYFYDSHHLEPEWRLEAGISIGLMNCLTDLGGHKGNGKKFIKDVNWKTSKACVGLFLTATHHEIIGLRIESNWGEVSGADSVLKNDQSPASLRYYRNLHFRSKLAELSALSEFHPIFLFQTSIPRLSPYLLLGVGYFKFQPEARINGSWVRLHNLHTEGQGFKEYPDRTDYKLQQVNIPVGLGLKYDLTGKIVMRLDFVYRILTTDYLDDVSQGYIDPSLFYKYFPTAKAELAQKLADRSIELDPSHQTIVDAIRGNPDNKDAYFSINLKISIVLNRRRV